MRCNGLPESTVGRKEVENREKCGKFTCLAQDTQCVQAMKAISQRGENCCSPSLVGKGVCRLCWTLIKALQYGQAFSASEFSRASVLELMNQTLLMYRICNKFIVGFAFQKFKNHYSRRQ